MYVRDINIYLFMFIKWDLTIFVEGKNYWAKWKEKYQRKFELWKGTITFQTGTISRSIEMHTVLNENSYPTF